jgi:hypothetical protein
MLEIKYNNNTDEIRRAYSLFRRKYAVLRMIPLTVMFLIAVVFGVDFIIRDPADIKGYILVALGLGMLISFWTRPVMAQKRLIATIEEMGEENYTARFFDDRIEVDTEFVPDEETEVVAISRFGVDTVENPEVLEEAEKELAAAQPETTVIKLGAELLYALEEADMFCLFVNKALIYIFPKRCLSDEQTEMLRNYFTEKAI